MNENNASSGSSVGKSDSMLGTAFDRIGVAKDDVTRTAVDASHGMMEDGRMLADDVRRAAGDQADKAKEIAASHMDAFADALRTASEELSKNQTGPASEMIAHAASGLESLSRSMHGNSTGDMIETIRQFGRTNPIGFLAGSVLAGLALGRFAAAGSAPVATSAGGRSVRSNASSTPSSMGKEEGSAQ